MTSQIVRWKVNAAAFLPTRHRPAQILTAGHAFAPNLRRGHYDIAMDVPARHRLRIAVDDLATTI